MGAQPRCLILSREDQMGVVEGRERESEQFQFLGDQQAEEAYPCGCTGAHWGGESRPASIWL